MLKMVGILVAASAGTAAAQAQETIPGTSPPAETKPVPTGAASGNGPVQYPTAPKLWFQVAVAPEVASDTPFSSDHTDSTDVSWTLGMDIALSPDLNLGATVGPTATIDSDEDAAESSKLNLAVELLTGASVLGGLSPSFKYQFSQRYESFFHDSDGQEHTFEAAFNHQLKFRGGRLDFSLGSRWFESTLANSDYWSIRLIPKLTIPIARESIDLTFNLTVERRRYEDLNPLIGRQRRDWRLEAVAGINLARAINTYLNRDIEHSRDIFRTFIIGVRWIGIDSNVEASDSSTFKFTPSVSIRVNF